MYVRLPTTADIDFLPMTVLASDKELEELEIHPGDRLFSLGFPLGVEANEAGFPILRSGNIASFPLLPTSKTKTFLFDFAVFGGNSGGPVYFEDVNRRYRSSIKLG
jgi:S1-C subfamily serine protease